MRFNKIELMLMSVVMLAMHHAAFADMNTKDGLPLNTKVTNLGDRILLNGIPAELIAISVPMAVKETSLFFAKKWSEAGWKVTVERVEDSVAVRAMNPKLQMVAMLKKTSEVTTEGTISVTDLPHRIINKIVSKVKLGEHIPQPINTTVLSEFDVTDNVGRSIMTTMTNGFGVEQNVSFFRERMVELGWKEKKHRENIELRGVILGFENKNTEMSFTIVRHHRQTMLTINTIYH